MNGHGENLETWLAFRDGERCHSCALECVECGGPAEGDVEVKEGPICNACDAKYEAGGL